MLFHTLADPEAGHYVEQFLCRLRGELDLAVLRESWHRLVARHPGPAVHDSLDRFRSALTRSSIVGPTSPSTTRIGEG